MVIPLALQPPAQHPEHGWDYHWHAPAPDRFGSWHLWHGFGGGCRTFKVGKSPIEGDVDIQCRDGVWGWVVKQ